MKLKYYLIASEINDYKPWITSSSALGLFAFIIWGLRILVPASITFATTYLDPSDIMNRINDERSKRYVITLSSNDKLILAAQGKSDDMLHRSYFSHIDPDGNYVWPRVEATGYKPYATLGENLAMDFSSPDDLIAAWMNSPTHRNNILNSKFEDQGLALSSGLYEQGHTTTLVASVFGTLANSTASPTPTTKVSSSTASTPNDSKTNAATSSPVLIDNDANIKFTYLSGHILIDIEVLITGNPKLVTAKLDSQSITLIANENNLFTGTFDFDSTANLNGQSIVIEARDGLGVKSISSLEISGINSPKTDPQKTQLPSEIPVSQEARLITILRIVFGILSVIYLGFLITDAIIIHRAKIERPAMHRTPVIVIFVIITIINLFAAKF